MFITVAAMTLGAIIVWTGGSGVSRWTLGLALLWSLQAGVFLSHYLSDREFLNLMRDDNEHAVWLSQDGIRIRVAGCEWNLAFAEVNRVWLAGSANGLNSECVLVELREAPSGWLRQHQLVGLGPGTSLALETADPRDTRALHYQLKAHLTPPRPDAALAP
jgi:hypothetical protein